jgi:hypothetical protein
MAETKMRGKEKTESFVCLFLKRLPGKSRRFFSLAWTAMSPSCQQRMQTLGGLYRGN